jgi:anti-anti-sigma regulatory factor
VSQPTPAETPPEVGRAVHVALAGKPQRLVIDLCAVAFVDYRVLSVLLNARRRALGLGVEPRLLRHPEHATTAQPHTP